MTENGGNLIKATLQSRLEAVWSGQEKSDLVRKSQIWSDLDEFQSKNARDSNRGPISGKSWTVYFEGDGNTVGTHQPMEAPLRAL